MDIMELGAIGELVGGVAVIASLIYVGLQVRQNGEQTKQSNAIERARANRETVKNFSEVFLAMRDPEALRIYTHATTDFDGLSDADKAVLHMSLAPLALHAITTFRVAREGLMDEEFGDAWVAHWVMMAKCPGIFRWWEHAKITFPAEFVAEVDRLLQHPEGPPPYHQVFPWFAGATVPAEA